MRARLEQEMSNVKQSENGNGEGGERVPGPELVERPRRRAFPASYKMRIVREADGCGKPGEIGALLRREGLYSSHLSEWRKQRDLGYLVGEGPKRGRPAQDRMQLENRKLRRRLERTEAELARAQRVIEVQGNVSALLGDLLGSRGASSNESTER
jgi:transposase